MMERLAAARNDDVQPRPGPRVGSELMDRITESFLKQFADDEEITCLPQDRQFEHFA